MLNKYYQFCFIAIDIVNVKSCLLFTIYFFYFTGQTWVLLAVTAIFSVISLLLLERGVSFVYKINVWQGMLSASLLLLAIILSQSTGKISNYGVIKVINLFRFIKKYGISLFTP